MAFLTRKLVPAFDDEADIGYDGTLFTTADKAGEVRMRLVIFGVSNQVGAIMDCALELKLTPSLIVMNMPEVVRPRTKSLDERLRLYPDPPRIIQLEDFVPEEDECYFIGTVAPKRHELVEQIRSRFGITCCTLIHPTAYVSPRASVASGVYLGPHSSIGPGAQIGEQASIHARTHVGHDAIIEPYAVLMTGCGVAGYVHVGYGVSVGMQATIIQELTIGAEAFIAAGAVVIEDVPPRVLVTGVPGRIKKSL